MAYYIDLFSPETYEAFGRSDRTVSGFRPRQRITAEKVQPGDKLICYMTRLSRWMGVLEVIEGPFSDPTPIFFPENDPFIVRFRVRPSVWLSVEQAIPIHDNRIWSALSFTRELPKHSQTWTGRVRGSLTRLIDSDGAVLETMLQEQARGGLTYPVDEADYRKLTAHRVRRSDRDITVTVPEDIEPSSDELAELPSEVRESVKIQALLAEIGSGMGMQIWLPRSDRTGVLAEWRGEHPPVLDRLPLNYDDTTLRTIEQIDVIVAKRESD